LPVVIPELQLIERQNENFVGDAMVFYQPYPEETPESLQGVDRDLAA
jgi:hypothetical protein